MKKEQIDVDNLFNIDSNLLDYEWINQPKLFFKYTEMLVEAEKKLDQAERKLKVIDAELDVAVRKNEEKITEAYIKNKIILDPKHKKQVKKVAARQVKVNLLKAIVQSLDQRKKALEKLVDLHGQQYFATPKTTERNQEFIDVIQNRAFISKDKKIKSL